MIAAHSNCAFHRPDRAAIANTLNLVGPLTSRFCFRDKEEQGVRGLHPLDLLASYPVLGAKDALLGDARSSSDACTGLTTSQTELEHQLRRIRSPLRRLKTACPPAARDH